MSKLEAVAIVQEAVMSSPRSVEEVAAHLDMRPSTLYAKLNPFPTPDHRHILGLEEAIAASLFVGSAALAAHVRTVLHADSVPDGRDMTHECLQGYEATSAFLTAANSGASYQALISLLPNVIKELEDVAKRARMEKVQGKARPAYMRKAG